MPEGVTLQHGPNTGRPARFPTVTVADFGRVAQATIKFAPLTVLVGRNNTGKSYIASLLWAVRSGSWGLYPVAKRSLSAPAWFASYVNTATETKAEPLRIEAADVFSHVNIWLAENGNAIVSDLMTLPELTVESFEMHGEGTIWLSPASNRPSWMSEQSTRTFETTDWLLSWNKEDEIVEGGSFNSFGDSQADFLFGVVIQRLLMRDISVSWGAASYIPAARTGLILSLKELAASTFQAFGLPRDQAERQFTRPMIDFLSTITRQATSHYRQRRTSLIADFLQDSVLQGDLAVEGKGVPTFTYQPEDSSVKLPMHAVSSMVTELAPILTIFRVASFSGGLIIEEPEAHLHLSAQRCMARALVRLVNLGVPVVVTTHSDTFVQQINLSMQLSTVNDDGATLADLHYLREDILDPDMAVAYEFVSRDGRTFVEEANKTEDGFVVRSLNETLIQLARDVMHVAEA